MPSSKRQKIDRTSTAAYAASQSLFDALKNATTANTDTQTPNLALARDVVQSLHVKIANDDTHNALERHEAYMEAISKAWISCTDSFCAIFEELVNITAADPTEGRDAGVRHDYFQGLLDTTRQARLKAQQYEDATDNAAKAGADADEEERADVEPAPSANGFGKRPMTVVEEATEEKEPTASTNGTSEKRTKRRAKRRILKASAAGTVTDEQPETKQAAKESDEAAEAQPEIEFEDVSAEVEARLQAKAEKKAAEKVMKATQKKRKRESGDSFVAGLEGLEVSTAAKPSKKKTKSVSPEENTDKPTKADTAPKPQKRKQETAEAPAATKQPASKRKKGKA